MPIPNMLFYFLKKLCCIKFAKMHATGFPRHQGMHQEQEYHSAYYRMRVVLFSDFHFKSKKSLVFFPTSREHNNLQLVLTLVIKNYQLLDNFCMKQLHCFVSLKWNLLHRNCSHTYQFKLRTECIPH